MSKLLSDSELASFAGELAMILHSGISALEGISILKEDNPSEKGTLLLSEIYESLEQTGELTVSLRETGVFPEYFLKMTELGERCGTLDEVMDALSEYYTRQHTLLNGIRDALTYPLILLVMLLAILIVLITQVMPVFEEVFHQLGIETGSITTAVFRAGNILQAGAAVLLLLVTVSVFFCFTALRTGKGYTELISIIQRIPFVQKIYRQISCARFSNALSVSLHSGLDISEGFLIARGLSGQFGINDSLDHAQKLLEDGNNFADSLQQSGIFTGMHARLLSIGFKTGSAETALQKISVSCIEDADSKIQNAVGMFEPVLTAVLAVLTGVILVSVMLPLLGVMTSLGI